jgi:1,4-dihydroxy-2-naphthoate octaprenyltransferase
MELSNIKIWVKAFRLRTLPLALSCSIMGSFLATESGSFRWEILLLAMLTTLFLQILSNLANDYGDAIHGVDNENRIGPLRLTQSGVISKSKIRMVIFLFSVASFLCGSSLIFVGLNNIKIIILFFVLGLTAIYAAVKYTIGKNPYGYIGLGDVFVFIFFGIVGVVGTFYLHTKTLNPWLLLPASSIGLLSSGVLNLNNMRDIDNDMRMGKRTLVVRMGTNGAKIYHIILLTLSMLFSLIYVLKFFHSIYQLLFLLTLPLFVLNTIRVVQNAEPVKLNDELKRLALSTFVYSLTFGIGLII